MKIISGGQTGVDRAALDWAIKNGVSYGGWCPLGRRAEDGVIPAGYKLREIESKGYMRRTKRNVLDSDATLIVSLAPELAGGSQFTQEYANKTAKPYLHIYPNNLWQECIKTFFEKNSVQTLNIAGPRGSNAPGIEQFVCEVLDEILAGHWNEKKQRKPA